MGENERPSGRVAGLYFVAAAALLGVIAKDKYDEGVRQESERAEAAAENNAFWERAAIETAIQKAKHDDAIDGALDDVKNGHMHRAVNTMLTLMNSPSLTNASEYDVKREVELRRDLLQGMDPAVQLAFIAAKLDPDTDHAFGPKARLAIQSDNLAALQDEIATGSNAGRRGEVYQGLKVISALLEKADSIYLPGQVPQVSQTR